MDRCWLKGGQESEPTFLPLGLQPKRAYFAQLPFESVDMVNGNLILTFTDLALPGDGGMDLVIQRSFSKQGVGWRFGIRGVPMEVVNPEAPWPEESSRIHPSLRTADGTDHSTVPYSSVTATDVWVTESFWRYTKDTRTVEMPNGWTAVYSNDPGRALLQHVADVYGNRISVEWEPYDPADVTTRRPSKFIHHLTNGTREVALWYDNSWRVTPSTMTFAGRTWSYGYASDSPDLISVTPPAGEDCTGFRTSQSIYGVATTFGRDGGGNRTSVTDANGHTMTTAYEWGVAKDTTTPEYGIARTINPDGTVASETRGDITRTFIYDGLGRPERVSESGRRYHHLVRRARGDRLARADLSHHVPGWLRPPGRYQKLGRRGHRDRIRRARIQTFSELPGRSAGAARRRRLRVRPPRPRQARDARGWFVPLVCLLGRR
jgi:hypothetical protein